MTASTTSPPASRPSTGPYATFNLPVELRMMILKELVPNLSAPFFRKHPLTIAQYKIYATEKTSRTKEYSAKIAKFKIKFRALGVLCLISKTTRLDALRVYVESGNRWYLGIDIGNGILNHQDYIPDHPTRPFGWFPLRLDIIPLLCEVKIFIRGCYPERQTAVMEQLNNISSLLQGDDDNPPKVTIHWDADYTVWRLSQDSMKNYFKIAKRILEICAKENRKTQTLWIHPADRPSGANNSGENDVHDVVQRMEYMLRDS